ncbi:MAG: serine/threonine protein kinase, partial [Deltaproteobacteria bacterium]|nr:serine/threonine protein kinase [Deltaproteobacteria bacterium]
MSDRTVEIAAGICPSCETAGTAGTPCPQAVCARRGYHFVPAEYYSGSTAADALVGRRADEYLIVRRIGKGGFGSVYLALQLPILLKCALKVLHESIEEQPGGDALMAKFRGEAEALARLNHPNIVRLIRFGEFEHRPYLVMEFIEGRSLRDEMRKAGADRRAISRTVVDKLMVQMLHGLEAAHAISIVHRDMKPENVLLQSVIGNPWYVRIVDFGLAKFTAAGTHTSVLSGTPAYMAPEQLIGQGICPASDVYAMGIIAYELLTGRRMYLGEGQDSILASKLNPGYCPFDSVDRTGLTDGELAFLQRATCHRSDDRFRTAGTMLEAWQGLQDARGQAAVVTVPVAAQPGQSTPTLGTLPHPSEPAASGEAAEGEGALHLLEQSDRFGRVGKASSSEVTPATAIGGTLQRSKGLRTAAWLAVGLAIAAAALVVLAMSGIFRKAPDGEPPGRAVVASKESRDSESGLGRPAGVPPDVRGPERLHEPDVLAPIDGGAAQPSPDIVGGLRPDVQPQDVQPAQAPDVQPRDVQPAQAPDVQP